PWNRLMEPGLVWLSFIPIFNIIWNFFIATRVPDSLRNEFRNRGQDDGSDYGKAIGLTNAVLSVVSTSLRLFLNQARLVKKPTIKIIFGPIQIALVLVSLVLFIFFWVRIAGYTKKLAGLPYDYEGPQEDRYNPPRGPSPAAIRPADPGS